MLVVMVLIALEPYILDPESEPYKMAWAWWEALKFWIAARFSDHFGIPPSLITRSSRGPAGRIVETKTTGPGKKVPELAFYLSTAAWLVDQDWQEKGLQFWSKEQGGRGHCCIGQLRAWNRLRGSR